MHPLPLLVQLNTTCFPRLAVIAPSEERLMWSARVVTVSRPLHERSVKAEDLESLVIRLRCAVSTYGRTVIVIPDARNPERLISEYTDLVRGGGLPYECEGYLTWFLVRPMAGFDSHPGLGR